MASNIHFYATREDLEPVIRQIEAAGGFRYALSGLHASRTFPEFFSAFEIPSLGRATGNSATTCQAFLVVKKDERIAVREVPQSSGGTKYAVDQLENPRSIIFQSGGVLDGGVIIHGKASTTGKSEEARQIFSLFQRSLKKHFQKRAAFYVGPAAMRLKASGARLTMAVQSPAAYDLA